MPTVRGKVGGIPSCDYKVGGMPCVTGGTCSGVVGGSFYWGSLFRWDARKKWRHFG